jgi:hypothetical protein
MKASHQVTFAVVGAQYLHVARREARIEETLGRRSRSERGVPDRIRRVDFDQFPENVVSK